MTTEMSIQMFILVAVVGVIWFTIKGGDDI
jgi:hypothetical protein